MDVECAGNGLVDLLEEREQIRFGVGVAEVVEHLVACDVERCEEAGRAVAVVVVGDRLRLAATDRQ